MTPPPGLDPRDFHETAWAVTALLMELMTFGGWLSSSDLADRCGLQRDTVRRMLRTLEARAWVRREPSDGRDLWLIGPGLPRIGVQYHELLQRRAMAIQADLTSTLTPFRRSE